MKHIIHYLLAVFLLTSCSDELVSNGGNEAYNPSKPMSFITQVENGAITRGTPVSNVSQLTDMGVFCSATGSSDWSATAPLNKMNNLPLINNSGTWSYQGPDVYWGASDLSERYSFFAYAPYESGLYNASSNPSGNGISVSGSNGIPVLDYTVPDDVVRQPDLMVSEPRYNLRPTGSPVALPMKHALTCVGFQIAGNGEQITGIGISGVSVSGSLAMDGGNIVWTNLGSATTADFSASINYDPGQNYFTAPAAMSNNLVKGDGYLMMIPQSLTSAAKIKLTFLDGSVKEVSLSGTTSWEAGKKHNYHITLSPQGSITIVPGTLLLPYTGVNHHTDNLDVICEDNNGNPDPSMNWSLTSSDPWLRLTMNSNGTGASATVSGQGSQTVYTVADANNATSSRMTTIYLDNNAAVKVNVTQVNNPGTISGGGNTPVGVSTYAGAFWRASQTGERIIRIVMNSDSGNLGDWVATVHWMDGKWNPGDIVLSTDLLTTSELNGRGITWNTSTENPQDAENFQVAGNATTVRGTVTPNGDILFRIGLKSTYTATDAYPARYAVVLLSYNNYTKHQKIFLRQGEDPDYLFGPTETYNDNGSNMPRSKAKKFSPYNVTASDLTDADEYKQIKADRSNAAFTEYPTQAGAFFQWANRTTTRYAYHPVLPIGCRPTWYVEYYIYEPWDNLVSTYAVCPQGYTLTTGSKVNFRRPTNGPTNTLVNTKPPIKDNELYQSLYQEMSLSPNITGSVWGFYADGFFDRRSHVHPAYSTDNYPNVAVSITTKDVACIGSLLFNENNNHSLFFPASGGLDFAGELLDFGRIGCFYLATSEHMGTPYFFLFEQTNKYARVSGCDRGHSLRPVLD